MSIYGWYITFEIFVFLAAVGFFEAESDSSLLLLITAVFARLPFLAVSFFGASAAFALADLAGFFAGSFACIVQSHRKLLKTS